MPLTDSSSSLLAQYEHQSSHRTGVSDWVTQLRHAGIAAFQRLGMPSRKDEEWRFTPIAPIVETNFTAGRPTIELSEQLLREHTFSGLDCCRLVVVNGQYAPELSDETGVPVGVIVGSLRAALDADEVPADVLCQIVETSRNGFTALNAAFLDDGVFVRIPANTTVDRPIQMLFLADAPETSTVCHPRVLVIAGANSRATLIESYAGPEGQIYLTNAVTEIVAGPDAVIEHYKVQRESSTAYHISASQAELARGSQLRSYSIALGGAIARNDTAARLGGDGITCTLNGVYYSNARRLVDNHTAIDHAMPRCESHELYKGILGDRARGVFNGKILVRPDAQKTDARQTNKTLLLSDEAQINTKPQLEIFADDVRCTHGATVGQLDAEALFYLRARGIGHAAARGMLVRAFAGEVIDGIKLGPVRERIDSLLTALLPHQE